MPAFNLIIASLVLAFLVLVLIPPEKYTYRLIHFGTPSGWFNRKYEIQGHIYWLDRQGNIFTTRDLMGRNI